MKTQIRGLVLACGLLLGASAAHAQVLRGVVTDQETGTRLELVRLTAEQIDGAQTARATTDTAGVFTLRVPVPGTYTLRAERLGYDASALQGLSVKAAEEVTLAITMSALAVVLDPIRITGRREFGTGLLRGYYERLEHYSRLGIGRFLTREDLERQPAGAPSDYLRATPFVVLRPATENPGSLYPLFRQAGRTCIPQLYVDGMLSSAYAFDYLVNASQIEGIELYRGRAEYPGDFYDPHGCGLILVWTRRDFEGDGRRWTVRRVLAIGAAVGLMTLSLTYF